MSDISVYDIPFSEIEQQVLGWVTEALEMRHGRAGDPDGPLTTGTDETPAEALSFLRRIRQRADRVDELLSKIIRAKGRAQRARAEAQFQADVAMSEAMSTGMKNRPGDFTSGRERESVAKLASFEQLRDTKQLARLVSVTEEAYEVVNKIQWQLSGMRNDVRAVLNALHFESSLER